jgi:hypothetical protein
MGTVILKKHLKASVLILTIIRSVINMDKSPQYPMIPSSTNSSMMGKVLMTIVGVILAVLRVIAGVAMTILAALIPALWVVGILVAVSLAIIAIPVMTLGVLGLLLIMAPLVVILAVVADVIGNRGE